MSLNALSCLLYYTSAGQLRCLQINLRYIYSGGSCN